MDSKAVFFLFKKNIPSVVLMMRRFMTLGLLFNTLLNIKNDSQSRGAELTELRRKC